MPSNPKARTVAIIGGGPSGAVALSSLVDEKAFSNITLFERKNDFGGTWRNDGSNDGVLVKPGPTPLELDPPLPVPSQLQNDGDTVVLKKRVSLNNRWTGSPAIYDSLRTNVPERIMAFSDLEKFPYLDKPDQDELTKRDSIEKYIVDYISRFETTPNVELKRKSSVEQVSELPNGKFQIIYKTDTTDEEIWSLQVFDAIIVATGHYNVPKIPNVKGIQEVLERSPNKIIHAKGFQPDESFKGKRVIVVGSRSSAVDTVREIKKFTGDVIWSVRFTNTGFNAHTYDERKVGRRTPRWDVIKEYIYDEEDNLNVVFEDGQIYQNPDYIVYATGYHFSFPFLVKQYPDLVIDGLLINNSYQHTFLISNPMLSFVGTPIDGMSCRVFEIQALLVSRYLSGKVELPSKDEQLSWFKERLNRIGVSRHFHSTINDPALDYIAKLVELGGGYNKIGDTGRDFPQFSELDLKVYEDNKSKLVERWSNV